MQMQEENKHLEINVFLIKYSEGIIQKHIVN